MVWFYKKSISDLEERTYNQLKTVRETKKKEIESYFTLIRQQAIYFAGGTLAHDALKDFDASFNKLKLTDLPKEYTSLLLKYYSEEYLQNLRLIHPDTFAIDKLFPKDYRSVLLQTQYLVNNKTAFKSNVYNTVHEKYHNAFSAFAKINGFYDVFLIEDKTGYVVYSVNKEIDFATSLLSDAHADSNLGRLFRRVRFSGLKYHASMCDFEMYMPSGLAPAAFIAAPIFEKEKKIGTLVFQIPVTIMNKITTSNKEWISEGLGETGECYIVGADCKMRTDSRFLIESQPSFIKQVKNVVREDELSLISFYKTTVLFLSICNESVSKALGNQSGTLLINDYRNIPVLSSYNSLNIADVNWVMLAEIDEWEALLPIQAFINNFFLIIGGVIGIVFLIALTVSHSFAKPISQLAIATKRLGEGNLNVKVDISSRDELGVLENSFNKTVESLRQQHSALIEKQEEISSQAELLSLVNEELTVKNQELDQQKEEILHKKIIVEQQKEEITAQAENLLKLNNDITQINNNLEAIVHERTKRLELQNKQLADYAFTNAHKLRGPLTRILGLINIIHISKTIEEKLIYVKLLNEAGDQLDEVVHTIQHLITDKENDNGQ
jgi:HAMP domain-containing protein